MRAAVRVERLIALLVSCFENLFHGGVIFGWPSLVFVLKDLGYYENLCSGVSENATTVGPTTSVLPQFLSENATTTTTPRYSMSTSMSLPSCHQQDAALQLVFTVTTAVQACCMFPVGYFFDQFGTRIARLVMTVLMLVGYVLMGYSSPVIPGLLYPATISFTIGGVMLILSSMQTGNLFGHQKSTVLALVNGLYSGSVLVFLIAKVAYDAGFSTNLFFFILSASTLGMTFGSVLFYPKGHIPWPLPENYRLPCGRRWACLTCQYYDEDVNGNDKKTDLEVYENKGYVAEEEEKREGRYDTVTGYSSQNGESGSSGANTTSPARRNAIDLPCSFILEERKRREFTSLRSCILSAPFCFVLVWQVIMELDMLFTFGTLNPFLTQLADGDEDIVSWYTNVFSITQFFVVIVGPLGGLLMDRNKLPWCRQKDANREVGMYADMQDSCLPLALTSLSSVLFNCCMLIPNLPLQYLTFLLILVQRSLLFGVGTAVVAVIFPMQYFASVYGAIRTIAGFFNLLQFPIFNLIHYHLGDDHLVVVVAFIVAAAITLVLPINLYFRAKRLSEEASKEKVSSIQS